MYYTHLVWKDQLASQGNISFSNKWFYAELVPGQVNPGHKNENKEKWSQPVFYCGIDNGNEIDSGMLGATLHYAFQS